MINIRVCLEAHIFFIKTYHTNYVQHNAQVGVSAGGVDVEFANALCFHRSRAFFERGNTGWR